MRLLSHVKIVKQNLSNINPVPIPCCSYHNKVPSVGAFYYARRDTTACKTRNLIPKFTTRLYGRLRSMVMLTQEKSY